VIAGAAFGMFLAREDESLLEFAAYGAAGGVVTGVGISIIRRSKHIG
jgi:hypothetical protein